MKTIISIVRKDFISEFRSRDMFISMFTFSLIIIFVFNLVLDLTSNIKNIVSPAVLWITFLFSGSIGLSRSYSLEKESEAIKGLLLAPVDRSLIYMGKFFSNLIFLLIIEIITIPIFIILFNYDFSIKIIEIMLVIFLGTIGFSSVGTLFSAISLNTRLREVLLPILYFPIIIPVLLNAVRITRSLLSGESLSSNSSSLQVLIAFDIIFLSAGILLYEYVIEESWIYKNMIILLVLTVISIIASLYASFVYAPTELVMGDIQRIFYFHMGTVWVATVAFTIVFIASIMFLKSGKRKWDILALSSAEIGVLFQNWEVDTAIEILKGQDTIKIQKDIISSDYNFIEAEALRIDLPHYDSLEEQESKRSMITRIMRKQNDFTDEMRDDYNRIRRIRGDKNKINAGLKLILKWKKKGFFNDINTGYIVKLKQLMKRIIRRTIGRFQQVVRVIFDHDENNPQFFTLSPHEFDNLFRKLTRGITTVEEIIYTSDSIENFMIQNVTSANLEYVDRQPEEEEEGD